MKLHRKGTFSCNFENNCSLKKDAYTTFAPRMNVSVPVSVQRISIVHQPNVNVSNIALDILDDSYPQNEIGIFASDRAYLIHVHHMIYSHHINETTF